MQQVMDFISQNSWIIYVGLVVVVILFILILLRQRNRKNINNEIERSQSRINTLKSYPFNSYLKKAEGLARINKDIEDFIAEARRSLTDIQEEIKNVQIMVNDSDELFGMGKLNDCRSNNLLVNERLIKLEETCSTLSNKFTSILQQETNQRNEIVDLKETYRALKNKANQNNQIYSYCWKALSNRNQHISELFTEFESVMMGCRYDEANKKKNEIAQELDKFNEILDVIPELIKTAKTNIPCMIEQVDSECLKLKQQGIYIDHLKVNDVIAIVNETLIDNLNKIKQCELFGVNDALFECETKMNQLYSSLQTEEKAYEEICHIDHIKDDNINILLSTLQNVEISLPKANQRYGFEGYKEKINNLKKEIEVIKELDSLIQERINDKQSAASCIIADMNLLEKKLSTCLEQVNEIASELAGAEYDEQSARQHLNEWSYALNEVVAQMRLNHIDSFSKSFEEDKRKAFDYIKEIEKSLNNPPIDIACLNDKIKISNTFISELCRKSIDNTINIAKKAEKLIVFANRYRFINNDIDSELLRAENIYRQGNYSEVITIVSNMMKKYDAAKIDMIMQGK